MSRKTREKLEHKEKTIEKRDRMLRHDFSAERAVVEEVFDQSTLMTVYHLLNKGIIDQVFGVVKAGKESRVYWGQDAQGNDLAIKIYLTVSAEFRKGILKYIVGDERFKRVKRGSRSTIFTWAQKEFRNLHQAKKAKVRVPTPLAVRKNVLVMEFIGKNGVSAPIIKEAPLKNPEKIYKSILLNLRRLYRKAKLVHGDLSEYNIMIWKNRPIIFDVSQAVPLSHPLADYLLQRDLKNLHRFFSSVDIPILTPEECYKRITKNGKR